jgi:hypothetical protein
MKNQYNFLWLLLFAVVIVDCNSKESNIRSSATKQGRSKNHVIETVYDKKGNLIYEQEYLKTDTGKIEDGFVREYYEDGKVKESGFYKMGYVNGESKFYYENGTLRRKLYSYMGSLVGGQYLFNKTGDLLLFVYFKSPNEIGLPDEYSFGLQFSKYPKVDSSWGAPFTIGEIKKSYKKNDTATFPITTITNPDGMVGSFIVLSSKFGFARPDTITAKNFKQIFHFQTTDYIYHCSNGTTDLSFIYTLRSSIDNVLIYSDTITRSIVVE